MPATYLGGFSVGGSIPGASTVLVSVGDALGNLRSTVQAQLGQLQSISEGLDAQIDALGSAKSAIRIPAVADLEVQLAAALDMAAGFEAQLTDPVSYINGLLSGIAEVSANIAGLIPPDLAISGQLAATASLAADFGLKIEAVDVQLELLTAIAGALSGVVTVALNAQAALTAAASATVGALAAYADLSAKLEGTAGAHCFMYEGNLGDLGAAVDALASGSTGIATDVPVRVPIVVVRADDVATNEGLDAVFRVS